MISFTNDYDFEWGSNDISLMSEEALKETWDNDIEDEAWKDL
jgi:hypothetical protein